MYLNVLIYWSTTFNRGSSYINCCEWIKNKGVTINPKNTKNTKNNMCFQYAITAALNHQNIDHHPERISNNNNNLIIIITGKT